MKTQTVQQLRDATLKKKRLLFSFSCLSISPLQIIILICFFQHATRAFKFDSIEMCTSKCFRNLTQEAGLFVFILRKAFSKLLWVVWAVRDLCNVYENEISSAILGQGLISAPSVEDMCSTCCIQLLLYLYFTVFLYM